MSVTRLHRFVAEQAAPRASDIVEALLHRRSSAALAVLLSLELGADILELAQDLRDSVLAATRNQPRARSCFTHSSPSSLTRNGKLRDNGVLIGRDTPRFAVTPGIDKKSLRKGALGLGFVEMQTAIPVPQPFQKLRILLRRIGTVIKLKFGA